ncbi:pyridoxine-5'-phosphate oxidase [Anthonomus grandis grandis]|uniref:pyridoxine-5'-phosphate oxidase n=1 Tax=Anthonomus grandis grandis TaxID=2921223 RepID=UPI00216533AE|nr:pyridoxine-5'-phosphate oxidase [Anthonomus grandis grandis]
MFSLIRAQKFPCHTPKTLKITFYSMNKGEDLSDLRKQYHGKDTLFLEETIEKKDPIDLFGKWFKLVKDDPRTVEANSMCLSTCTKDGFPSGRQVLLKSYGEDGFRFCTHYTSRKGQEIEENPRGAITFYWEHFHRSVRIEGTIEKAPFSDADEYFSKRPYTSQIGALCSDQSKPVANRAVLEAKEKELKAKYKEGEVPRPPLWGIYILKPRSIEFWQGQTDRIHDRIRFRFPNEGEPDGVLSKQGDNGWIYERLCP